MKNNKNLTHTWVKYHHDNNNHDYWAFEQMEDLIHSDPETAWSYILEIMEFETSDNILGNLAAGPLEELLYNHGNKFIDRVELLARQEPKFTKLIKGVWVSEMPKSIKTRLIELQEKYTKNV